MEKLKVGIVAMPLVATFIIGGYLTFHIFAKAFVTLWDWWPLLIPLGALLAFLQSPWGSK